MNGRMMHYQINRAKIALIVILLSFTMSGCVTCKYGFNDTTTIPEDVKNFRVNFFENKARYNNPQLAPTLTEKLRQKIIGNTKLRQSNSDDADYDISGWVSDYTPSTSGISNGNTSANRLNVTFHMILKNNRDINKKVTEADITNSFEFPASQSLAEAESALFDKVVKFTIDGIFNKIFVNW